MITDFTKEMIPLMTAALLITALLRFWRSKYITTSLQREGAVCIFAAYFAGLAAVTVIPEAWPSPLFRLRGTISLMPGRIFFDTWREVAAGNWAYLTIAFIGNIIIFIPIGFFVSLLWRGASLKKAELAGLLTSVIIELCQLPLDRWTDIDDLWLNTLGAAIGYLIYVLLNRPQWGLTGTASHDPWGRTPYRGRGRL